MGPGVEVLLVRADHEARPMPHRPNGASGMLLRGGGVVVWFAGDTSLHPDMALLPELARLLRIATQLSDAVRAVDRQRPIDR